MAVDRVSLLTRLAFLAGIALAVGLAACAPAVDSTPPTAPAAPVATAATSDAVPERPAPGAGQALPPARAPGGEVAPGAATPGVGEEVSAPIGAAVKLDMSCSTNADCTVKDVGNCCGYYPACVNKGSPTDPAAVKAACEASGMMATCGFREIQACQCVQGRCEAQDSDVPQLQ